MIYVGLVLLGIVPLTLASLAVAAAFQLGSLVGLDWQLERRDDKRHVRSGGWPTLDSFPVVGEPDFSEKLAALRRRR